jgi:hypothetical protein
MTGPDAFPPEMWPTSRARPHPGLGLDDQTADRLLVGAMPPADAPPAYRGAAQVLQAIARPGSQVELASEAHAVARVSSAFAVSRPPSMRLVPRRSWSARALSVAVAASSVTLFGGLAAAGALPSAAQGVASDMLAKVGVSVPSPDDHAGDHPDTRGTSTGGHPSNASQPGDTAGTAVSGTARTTDSTGVNKGREISGEASSGQSKAGDHGTPSSTPSSPPAPAQLPNQADNGISHRP